MIRGHSRGEKVSWHHVGAEYQDPANEGAHKGALGFETWVGEDHVLEVPKDAIASMEDCVSKHGLRKVLEVKNKEGQVQRHTDLLDVDDETNLDALWARRNLVHAPVKNFKEPI